MKDERIGNGLLPISPELFNTVILSFLERERDRTVNVP
jgi:hypothetical protein